MPSKKASGYALTEADMPTVFGMLARDDRDHDIAAWFGVNQGRIKQAKDGKWGTPGAAPQAQLPPKGPPGIKGRRLRDAVRTALQSLPGSPDTARDILQHAASDYDANEA